MTDRSCAEILAECYDDALPHSRKPEAERAIRREASCLCACHQEHGPPVDFDLPEARRAERQG